MAIDVGAVLDLSRDLQQATSLERLIEVAAAAIRRTTGYQTAWVALFEPGPEGMVQGLLASGSGREGIGRVTRFPSKGDAMLDEIRAARAPVVVLDARVDPRTNKEIVGQVGNRTIINVPLHFGDDLLGALGTGTFAPEGPRGPSEADLEILVVFATQLAAALQRVQLLDARAVMQRQLQAAQRLESLAVLAGGVAHDFNNLLTVVLSGATLARDEATAAQRALLDEVLEAAERARQLTRQLLALGRRQPLELTVLDPAPRLRALLGLARRLLPETIAVEADLPEALPPVLGDGQQLDQVLLNLIVNARDAMPGGGRLRVAASEQPPTDGGRGPLAGPHLRVTVTDEGPGMAPEVLERVMEPFFTTKPVGQGTGLGLAVAAGIVEQHGGTLTAESAVGAGSTFTIRLPAVVRDQVGEAPAAAGPAAAPGVGRLLLAEDEAAVRAMAERILVTAGYQVTSVVDGQAAIDAAQGPWRYDLVILDAVMPGVSGREALERIRAMQPATRFLLVSGHASIVFPAEEVRALGLPFLEKPYTPAGLVAAVQGAMARPVAGAAAPAA